MGFRFRQSISIIPEVRVNLNIGSRGASPGKLRKIRAWLSVEISHERAHDFLACSPLWHRKY